MASVAKRWTVQSGNGATAAADSSGNVSTWRAVTGNVVSGIAFDCVPKGGADLQCGFDACRWRRPRPVRGKRGPAVKPAADTQ